MRAFKLAPISQGLGPLFLFYTQIHQTELISFELEFTGEIRS